MHPKEGFAETAFQGMLVSRKGEYIWRTKETEALSEIYYRTPDYIERQKKDSKNMLVVNTGSLKFQSNDSQDIWVEVIIP